MKKLIILGINFYQSFLSVIVKNILGIKSSCRYSTTCSQYAKTVIAEHGIIKGGILAIKRIFSCQPFSRFSINK